MFAALGASLHDVLTRIKSRSSVFPKIDLIFSRDHPLNTPIAIRLPTNAITLRFDAKDQRLRYIEVLDFTRMRFTYKGHDIVRLNETSSEDALSPPTTGPAFRTVYKLFGPTTPGEYIHPSPLWPNPRKGKYCLSYPGISFMFPMEHSAWSQDASWSNIVSVLSSSATDSATSMCIFHGESWQKARGSIYTAVLPFARTPVFAKNKENVPKEIERVQVHGEGRLELTRNDAPSFWIIFGETTPQDLVTELGPPDTIYRNTRKHSIHRDRANSHSSSRKQSRNDPIRPSSLSGETDLSSQADTSDDEDDIEIEDPGAIDEEHQVWYNYYHHGFDILIGNAPPISLRSPTALHRDPTTETHVVPSSGSSPRADDADTATSTSQPTARNHPTAVKAMLHGNIPGSWQFNRHRRLRWALEHVPSAHSAEPLHSEMPFHDIASRLQEVFRSAYASAEDETALQQPMALNRGWGAGESLTGSVEFLGEWEESGRRKRKGEDSDGGSGLGGAELYGFPGLVFEVLRNGAVSDLLVY